MSASNLRPSLPLQNYQGNPDAGDRDTETTTTDDDDMNDEDFETATEETEDDILLDDEDEEDEDDDMQDFHDAGDNLSNVEFEIIVGDESQSQLESEGTNDEEVEGERTETEATTQQPAGERRTIQLSRQTLLHILGTAGLRELLASLGGSQNVGFDVEDDDEDDISGTGYGLGNFIRRRRRARGPQDFPKVPNEAGRHLMQNGDFGAPERAETRYRRPRKLTYRLMRRELGLGSEGRRRQEERLLKQGLIPSTTPDNIIHYDYCSYSGQFSDDGTFYYSCGQDFNVRMYDTSNPYNWKYYKKVNYPFGQWTLTDATLSPDNQWIAYSSIRSIVCLASTSPHNNEEPYHLDFSNVSRSERRRGYGHFGIYSIRFSGDGREIVAGTGDRAIYVYDIETRQSILRIQGHAEDVNAVCFADTSSPHILYSGSDDTTLKVWDRRSLGDGRAAGVFLGHTEGITYVDSKGDGRYVLSNGKEQQMKLWDLRKMLPEEKMDSININNYTTGFDYRFTSYDEDSWQKHPMDCSVVTFRGHKVLQTLIRCHFSPPGSTDSRYVYSGSQDGKVYIWNMDATIAGVIDVYSGTKDSRPLDDRPRDPYGRIARHGSHWKTCVRDASWHPYAPVIVATSWNGFGASMGSASVHTWKDGLEEDEDIMARRVNARLEHDNTLYTSAPGGRRMRGYWDPEAE